MGVKPTSMTLLSTVMIGITMLNKLVFFDKLKEVSLTVNLAKSEFGCAKVSFLGHIEGQREFPRLRPFHGSYSQE